MTTELETITAIQKEITRLERKAAQISRHQKTKIVAKIVKMMRSNDLNVDDIEKAFNRPHSTTSRSPAEVKYQHPNGATWVGRGRVPDWIKNLEAAGESRESYRVDKTSSTQK